MSLRCFACRRWGWMTVRDGRRRFCDMRCWQRHNADKVTRLCLDAGMDD